MPDVTRSLQSWVSTIQTVVLTADVFQLKKYCHSWRFSIFLLLNIISVVLTADVYHSNGRTHSWRFSTSKIYIFRRSWKTSAVSTNCLNGWNSTLQAAWYIRHVRIIWCLWTKPTIWWLILSFTQTIVRACSMFYHEGYRSVTPLDAARVSRTIFNNHSVHWYYITLIKGRDYIKHDIHGRHGQQNPRRGRWL